MFGTFLLLSVLPKQNCKFFDGTVKFTYNLSVVALSFRLLPEVSFFCLTLDIYYNFNTDICQVFFRKNPPDLQALAMSIG